MEKVVCAIENIFPGLIMDILDDRIEAYDGPDSLLTLHRLLREQKILDTARSVMLNRARGKCCPVPPQQTSSFYGIGQFSSG